MRIQNAVIRTFVLTFCLFLSSVSNASDVTTQPRLPVVSLLDGLAGTAADEFAYFSVLPSDSKAGAVAGYQVTFQLTDSVYAQMKNGTFLLAFPDGFGLSQISSVELTDNSLNTKLQVESWEVTGQVLSMRLEQVKLEAGLPVKPPDSTHELEPGMVEVAISITNIVNSIRAGDYQLSGLALRVDNFVVAGPTLSLMFTLAPGSLTRIVVTPGNDTTLAAGQAISFSASGYDIFSNKISGLVFVWSLGTCTDCIGLFTDSTLLVTRVGQGRATASCQGLTGQSGIIRVVPGDLYRMALYIATDQVVETPLLSSAAIVLYDQYNNLKTDYNLASEPITIVPLTGTVEPSVISDNVYQVGGVVRLLDVHIRYLKPSVTTGLYATNGSVMSNTVTVSFNGYDILNALDEQGATITRVFAGHHTYAYVPVQNSGTMVPLEPVAITAYYKSGGEPLETVFTPQAGGVVDTIKTELPILSQVSEADTLVLRLDTRFSIGGITYSVSDIREFPVSVLDPSVFTLVDGTFKPDSILAGKPFGISFEVFAEGFGQIIDSTNLTIQLVTAPGTEALATLYSGSPEYSSLSDGVILYEGFSGILDSNIAGNNGSYLLKIDYRLFSSGNVFTLESLYPDSIFAVFAVDLGYVAGSLIPTVVHAGVESSFGFDLNLAGDLSLKFIPETSFLTVTGSGFFASTNISLDGAVIVPGTNLFDCQGVFIPTTQLGRTLSLSAQIRYQIPGIPDTLTLLTNFNQESISVVAFPVLQIVAVDAVAPNAPKVNTNQSFQISCRVANLTDVVLDSLLLQLTSYGSSVFEPVLKVTDVPARDTIEVFYDVVAAGEPNIAEAFRVDILSTDVSQLIPLDNFTLVSIETPAELDLSYLLFGTENNLVEYGSSFNFVVEFENRGTAEVSSGAWRFIIEGVDSNGPDTLTGPIEANRDTSFSFTAPNHDTTMVFRFDLVVLPNDLNTGATAAIGDTSFVVSLSSVSGEAALLVESELLGLNLMLPGREKDFLQLDLSNTGISSITTLQVEQIEMLVYDSDKEPVDAREVFDVGNTGFYENDSKVTSTTAGGNRLVFSFDSFLMPPQQERSIVLRIELKSTAEQAFQLDMPKNGVLATFVAGPNAGDQLPINSGSEGESLISEVVTVKEADLEGSFMVESNPFNPDDPLMSPVRFSYELAVDAAVEFRIFTLTGEEVYSRDFAGGAVGGTAGENVVTWDGRNDSGYIVMNGVYVVVMTNVDTGETARIKLAVVK